MVVSETNKVVQEVNKMYLVMFYISMDFQLSAKCKYLGLDFEATEDNAPLNNCKNSVLLLATSL